MTQHPMADGVNPIARDEHWLHPDHLVTSHPRVAILMCTYNGAAYLPDQLDSFARQSFRDWILYVSDDASTDRTLDILSDYQRRWGRERLVMFQGPRKGFAENFMSLVQRGDLKGDYFAFSDQDDVWFDDKLARSLACLEAIDENTPALHSSRTRLVDANRNVTGLSASFTRPPSFRNALVQSLAGANTMLINQAARRLLQQVPENASLIAHDWLAYLLVSGCGGVVIHEAAPCLDYRQHGANLIGASASVGDRVARMHKMLSGRFKRWNDANVAILKALEPLLTDDSREVLADFDAVRTQGLFKRVGMLRKAGLYRQTRKGNFSLFLAVCLGKV